MGLERVRTMRSRPEDGYVPATSNNLFLDRIPNENEREEKFNKKISDFLKASGCINEADRFSNTLYENVLFRLLEVYRKNR